jgi:uncharacterized protein YndB with AHSA1/START domain
MTAPVAKSTPPQLRIRRTYDAPREMMFRLWTEPEHIKRWWAPRDFTVPHAEFDARPGGKLRIDFRGPDGFVFANHGEVKEVSPFDRLAFTTEYRHGGDKLLVALLHTVEFSDEGGGTRIDLDVTVTFADPEAAESLAHMEQGTNEQMDKLEELVTALKGKLT